MQIDIIQILKHMDVFAMSIVLVLGVMAVASLAVFVERNWSHWRNRRISREFAGAAAPLLDRRDFEGLTAKAKEFEQSSLAMLLGAGAKSYMAAVRKTSLNVDPVELTRRELDRRREVAAVQIRRGMSILATVGSVSPFVGLLGTVVGIIAAFEGIAKEGSGGLGAVSSGIAEALVVTAFGLCVAIPAVLAFNFLSTKADGIVLALEHAAEEFIDHIEAQAHLDMASPTHRPQAAGHGRHEAQDVGIA